MKLGDNFNKRMTIRLSDAQYVFIMEMCDLCGMTPSEYIRMVLDSSIAKVRGFVYEDKTRD